MRKVLFCLIGLLASWSAFAQSNFYVRFPDDVILTTSGSTDFGEPEYLVISGDAPTASFSDEEFNVIPYACHLTERTWIIKSSNYNPALACDTIINPTPIIPQTDPANLPGPVLSPAGTAAPWVPTVSYTWFSNPQIMDYSTFWTDTANCYMYKQLIMYVDFVDPVIEYCYPYCPIVFDETPNDPFLWNNPVWINPSTGGHDLSEAPHEWNLTASDAFYGNDVDVHYVLFMDTDNDGVMETAINSLNPPAPGQVNLGNTFNPNYSGGTPVNFDERPVPADQKYRFALRPVIHGDTLTVTMLWNTEANPDSWVTPQFPQGTHKIKWYVTDQCGNEAVCEHLIGISSNNFVGQQTLQGTTLIDADADCQPDAAETLLPGWRARLESLDDQGDPLSTQFSSALLDGKYRFWVDTGSYMLSIDAPNGYWEICQDPVPIIVDTTGGVTVNDFSAQAFVQCPFLETDIGAWALRRCFNNTYTARYCNTGTATAEDAYLRLTLDPYMSLVSSELPGIDEGNNVWRFELGDIEPGECGSFPLVVYLDCDSTVLGQTHCIEAHIYPDTFCLNAPGWSGANIEVDGACQTDSVRFVLSNTGTAPSSTLDYIVIEDNIINYQGAFQLPEGDSMVVLLPANGSTWRLEAQQEPGNPLHPFPSATVEACGLNGLGGFSFGYVSQFGEDDRDPFVSVDCRESTASLDPNDKQGFPLGYGDEHYIRPGQPLDYLIRFQNTGNDTAFQVVIRDTLPAWLDPSTVVPGASSHDYRFELSGTGYLSFAFDNILLPDSTTNEPASHGFVKFEVKQRTNIPLGTVLNNRAGIYFDFNEPVITNYTHHTVGENFVAVHTSAPAAPAASLQLSVSPNPAGTGDLLWLKGAELDAGLFEWIDGLGRTVMQRRVVGNTVETAWVNLPAGVYGFRVSSAGRIVGMGRMMWR